MGEVGENLENFLLYNTKEGVNMFKNLFNRKQPKIAYKYKKNGIYHDKVEKTKEYKQCIAEVEKLAEIEAKELVYDNAGHFNASAGYTEFKDIEQYL